MKLVLGIFHLVKAYTKLSYGERLTVKPSPGESLPNSSLLSGRQKFDHELNTFSVNLVLTPPTYLFLLYNISLKSDFDLSINIAKQNCAGSSVFHRVKD